MRNYNIFSEQKMFILSQYKAKKLFCAFQAHLPYLSTLFAEVDDNVNIILPLPISSVFNCLNYFSNDCSYCSIIPSNQTFSLIILLTDRVLQNQTIV